MGLIRTVKYPKASQAEIDALKSLIKKVDRAEASAAIKESIDQEHEARSRQDSQPSRIVDTPIPGPAIVDPVPVHDLKAECNAGNKVFQQIANVEVTRDAIPIDNPALLSQILMPELKLYKWQFESLMQLAGYTDLGAYKNKAVASIEDPIKMIIAAANGSGKDMVLIALFAIWFTMVRARNRVVITSSSFDQTKYQTEVHVRELAKRANKKFGTLFRYTQFHYVIPELGSEIKMFATDEAKRAEGYHPYGDGSMAIIVNEAKSVSQEIFEALSRCTGYSHWLEVSSPGPRSGHMFNVSAEAIQYPAPLEHSKFYFRRVTAYECPHIPRSHIEAMKIQHGESSPWFKSSILAEFSDLDSPVVISEETYDKWAKSAVKPSGADLGIGLDLAGGGDEDACFVRRGNKVIKHFFFRQTDTMLAANIIDLQLEEFKKEDYIFRADNGGVGQAIIDKLRSLGWKIIRTNNQSPATQKAEFLNLGAQMWFYVKRLIERLDIVPISGVDKLRHQLTTRNFRGLESTQGKFALESKKEARLAGRVSPDRADAFVLCFYSYRPTSLIDAPKAKEKHYLTAEQLVQMAHRGMLRAPAEDEHKGRFTLLDGKI